MTIQKNNEFWLDSSFKIKSDGQEDGKLTVAGYASTSSEDRAGDIIPMSAWEDKSALENYLKNPIILFQHDHDEPIGKMVDYQVDDTGLFVEIEIFNVDQRVYKLVKEGVLKAFSVGFRMKDYKYDQEKGVFIITELELFEISVVSIPCNQDSTFSLKKSMKDSDFQALRKDALQKAESKKSQMPAFNSELEKLAYLLANQ